MSTNKKKATTRHRSVASEPGGNYEVGYRRPPVEHQFKPGNNANPKGRRKGSRNRKVVVQEVLLEPIAVREGGEVKEMTKLEALLKKTMADALAGDRKAAAIIFALAQKEGLLTPEQVEAVEGLAEDDASIIEAYNRRIRIAQPAWPGERVPAAADAADAEVGPAPTVPAGKQG